MASRSGQISRSGPEKSAHISPDHAPGHLAEISGATNIHPVSRFPDPCFLIEPDTGKILDFNTLALELLGYEPEELLAKTIFDLKFGLSREEFRSYVDQTGDRLFTALPLSQLLRRDGSSVSVELNLGLTTADGFRAIFIVARDITERERAEQERAVIAEIGRIISSSLDINDIYARFVNAVHEILESDRTVIAEIDLDRRTITPVFINGVDVQGSGRGLEHPLDASPLGPVIDTRKALLLDRPATEALADRYPVMATRVSAHLYSHLAVPLISNDEVVGMFTVSSTKDSIYDERDLDLAEQVAAQISGAVAASRLYARTRKDLKEKEVLAEIGRVMGESLDIDVVYDRFAQSIKKLFDFDRITVSEFDIESNTTTPLYVAGLEVEGWEAGSVHPVEVTQLGSVFLDRLPLLLSTQSVETHFLKHGPAAAGATAGLRSGMAVPLIIRDQVLGALNLSSFQQDAYTEEDLELLERVGQQIANAVSNARLFAATSRDGRERAAIAAVGLAVNSDLDLEAIYASVDREISRLIDSDRIAISLISDSDRKVQELVYVSGVKAPGFEEGDRIPNRHTPGREWGWLRFRQDTLSDGKKNGEISSLGLRSRIVATFGSPDSDPLGYISLRSYQPNAYQDADLDLLEQIAVQITPAIVNAQLLTRVRGAAAQEERTRISRDIHDSVAQGLSGLLWQIDEIEDSIKTDPSEALGLIEKARHAATSSLLDTRRAVWGLRPGELGGRGLPDALRRETERIALECRLNWEFNSTGKLVELMPQLELALLRVGQEAVYNTVRHADANAITMALKWSARFVELVITDDGVGFDVEEASGATDSAHGLHAMKERAQENGATLEIRSTPGTGTTVTMKVPYQR